MELIATPLVVVAGGGSIDETKMTVSELEMFLKVANSICHID